jgi:hypothetical protein
VKTLESEYYLKVHKGNLSLLTTFLVLTFSPAAHANFSYDDKSQIVVSEITYSSQTINTKDNDEPITIHVKASDAFNSFKLAVVQFISEKGGSAGFAFADPFSSGIVNGVNVEEFTVPITIPKSFPEGILYLVLRFDANKPDGSSWHSDLYDPTKYVPAATPLPSQLSISIINSYSAQSIGAAKAAADKAALEKAIADKAAADKLAADKAALDKAIADKVAADKAALDKAIAWVALQMAKTGKPAQTTIICSKGKTTATIKGLKPKCPAGFTKKP